MLELTPERLLVVRKCKYCGKDVYVTTQAICHMQPVCKRFDDDLHAIAKAYGVSIESEDRFMVLPDVDVFQRAKGTKRHA